MIEGKELFRNIHNHEGRYDAKLHIAEVIALLGPPPSRDHIKVSIYAGVLVAEIR